MKSSMGFLLAVLLAAVAGCSKKEASKPVDIENNSSGNPVTAPVDYLGAVNKARKSAVRNIDLASMKNAIQLFNANEDRYPKSLEELAQKHYIQAVPELPAGSQFQYNAATGELKVLRK